MAVLRAFTQIDMSSLETWFGVVDRADSGTIRIVAGDRAGTYSGSFSYDSFGNVFGQLTGYSVTFSGEVQYSVEDMFVDANTAFQLVSNGEALELAQIALSGDDWIFGSNLDDSLVGFDGNDVIEAGGGNDVLTGLAGNDVVNGGAGIDRVPLGGFLEQYLFEGDRFSGNFIITDIVANRNGSDRLISIERIEFLDGMLALDVEGNAGQIYRLYQAAFDREPDDVGLNFWISVFDKGSLSLRDIANQFISSPEFQLLYGAEDTVTNRDFITLLYNNVLDRDPDISGFEYWSAQAENGMLRESMLAHFSESSENISNVSAQISDGIWYGFA